jgi:O-antigen/teichoic acid export membrane protein
MSRRTLSDTAYSSFALYIEYLFGLVASVLIARALLPADMGIYSLLVWVAANAIVVANAGITLAAIKFIAELRGGGRDDLTAVLVRRLRSMQTKLLLCVVLALGAIFTLARDRIAPGVEFWLLGLLILSVALRAPYMFNIAVLKGAQDFRSTAVVAVVGAGFNLALVILAWAKAASLPMFVTIYAVSSLAFYAVSQWRASRFARLATGNAALLSPELETRMRHHLRVVAFTTIFGTIGNSEIELLSLNLLSDAADAGLFKVANAVASGVALLLPGVLSAQLLPIMASAQGRGEGEAARRFVDMSVWLYVLGAPLIAAGAVFSEHVVQLLYGNAYAAAAPVLTVLLIARVSSVLGQGATAYLLSADRQTALMQLTVVFSAFRLLAAFACTYAYGLTGAILSTMVLALFGSGITIRLAMRVSASGLPWARLLRISVAAVLPALCCIPIANSSSALPGLLSGTVVFAIGYPLALWMLHGLSVEDANRIRGMAGKLLSKRKGSD